MCTHLCTFQLQSSLHPSKLANCLTVDMWNNQIMVATWNQLTKVCIHIKMQIVRLELYYKWHSLTVFNDSNVQTTLLTGWSLAWHVYQNLHQNKIPSRWPSSARRPALPVPSLDSDSYQSEIQREKTRENFQNFQNKSNQPSEGKFIVLACVCDHAENVNGEDEKLCKRRKISTHFKIVDMI